MKRKATFVTNSSTTSYVFWGVTIDTDVIKGNLEGVKRIIEEYNSNHNYKMDIKSIIDEEDDIDKRELADLIGSTYKNLESHVLDDELYIGFSPCSIGEDKTVRQAKEELITFLKTLGIECNYKNIEYIEEAFYDG